MSAAATPVPPRWSVWPHRAGATRRRPAEAATGADFVVSVVVNAAQTETILFGDNGVAAAMPTGGVFISSATMDPDAGAADLPRGSSRPAASISMRRSAAVRSAPRKAR